MCWWWLRRGGWPPRVPSICISANHCWLVWPSMTELSNPTLIRHTADVCCKACKFQFCHYIAGESTRSSTSISNALCWNSLPDTGVHLFRIEAEGPEVGGTFGKRNDNVDKEEQGVGGLTHDEKFSLFTNLTKTKTVTLIEGRLH